MPGTQLQDATQSTRVRSTQSPARSRRAMGALWGCSRRAVSAHASRHAARGASTRHARARHSTC
eukprot:9388403-Alexandrium_andersonii.AAC.1